MNTHRAIRTTPKRPATPAAPAGTAAGWMLLSTALGVCAVAWLILQWGSSTDATSLPPAQATAVPVTVAPLPEGATTSTIFGDSPLVPTDPQASQVHYNPDPLGSLLMVLEAQGEGLMLVGGAVFGGSVLLLVVGRYLTRIPADPLATGLGRTITLLENDHRAGNLTPQRALELARQAVAMTTRDHEAALAARTQTYNDAVAALTRSHAETVTALRTDAAQAVQQAQAEARRATDAEASALRRVTHQEGHIAGLNRDLELAHTQLVEQRETLQAQADELAQMHRAMEEAADTLAEWKTAHTELHDRYTALSATHADLKAQQKDLEAKAQTATIAAEQAGQEATDLRSRNEVLEREKEGLSGERDKLTKEVARLQGVSLRELPMVIPDREGDLAPHMASLVTFIRGTTMDTGAAGGERTTKPVLSSWRDIRRLFQVLKGVGLRFAVPAHHTPRWVEGTAGADVTEEAVQKSDKLQSDKQTGDLIAAEEEHCSESALTDSPKTVHNGGLSRDFNTSDADALPLLTI